MLLLNAFIASLFVGLLIAGASYLVLGFFPLGVGRKKAPTTKAPINHGRDRSEDVTVKSSANSAKPQRITPKAEWRGGRR